VADLLADMRLDVGGHRRRPAARRRRGHPDHHRRSGAVRPEVAHVVEGVTKLSAIQFSSSEERQAENFRKMLLAMVDDIRVILVKLADRLHNMRTLHHLPEERGSRIAQETRDIYAPIANRLGMSKVKNELEELAFKLPRAEGVRGAPARVESRRKATEG
jgi:GTP diphosphokinase / guanosine-3',5'-bis(diphosphate) 3'-diphosphatase